MIYKLYKKKESKLEVKLDNMLAFLEIPMYKEKISYTTNCIENGNKIFKSFIRNKGPFYGLEQFIIIYEINEYLYSPHKI